MKAIEKIIERASALNGTVVLPEGMDARVITAACSCVDRKICTPTVLGTAEEIAAAEAKAGLSLAEHGIKGVEAASGWHGLFAPAGTPAEIVEKLNAALQPILASAAIKERIIALGAEPASSTSAELAKVLAEDLVRLEPIVKKTGASLD